MFLFFCVCGSVRRGHGALHVGNPLSLFSWIIYVSIMVALLCCSNPKSIQARAVGIADKGSGPASLSMNVLIEYVARNKGEK